MIAMRTIWLIAVRGFQGIGPRSRAVRDGGVRGAADGGVVPDRQMTAGQDMKIIKDLGLAALSIFGLFIAVFIGIGLVSKEVEKKSVFGLLTKPVSRAAIHPRQICRPGDDARGQLGVMTIAYYARAVLHVCDVAAVGAAPLAGAGDGSATADRDRA